MSISNEFYEKYKAEEIAFAKCIEKYGYTHKKANAYQDIHEHWDLLIEKDGKELKVDVKAIKKIHRDDPSANENIHWLELKNVKGENGWAFSEHNDGIVFELRSYWFYVDKYKLQEFIKESVNKEKIVQNPYDAFYCIYPRRGKLNEDILTLVKTIDLLYIKDLMFKK